MFPYHQLGEIPHDSANSVRLRKPHEPHLGSAPLQVARRAQEHEARPAGDQGPDHGPYHEDATRGLHGTHEADRQREGARQRLHHRVRVRLPHGQAESREAHRRVRSHE